ncbi:MAG: ABC transporter permease, partial [Marinifilaceae bacterium]
KNKGLSAINIFGLSISIAICLLSYLFISFEYSHDDFHKDGDRIFELVHKTNYIKYGTLYNAYQKRSSVDVLKRDMPEVEDATAYHTWIDWLKYDNKRFQQKIAFIDSSFFKMFSFETIVGRRCTSADDINSTVISKEFADKLLKANSFSDYSKLIGRSIQFSKKSYINLTIVGVLKPLPKNSSLQFDMTANHIHSKYFSYNRNFGSAIIFLKLKHKEDKIAFEKKSDFLTKTIYDDIFKEFVKSGYLEEDVKNISTELVNINDIYLSDRPLYNEYYAKGDNKRISILKYISLIVLLLACINYIMLSIGLSIKRFKEIAVKKVFGSKRSRLIYQFITESSITVIISILLSVVISELSLPLFNDLIGYNLDFNLYTDLKAYLFLIFVFVIIVCVISIPAIYISKQKPVSIFRNNSKMGAKLGVAKSFILIQFSLSLILIITSIFINKQIKDMKSQDVGFNTENVITVDIPADFPIVSRSAFKNRLLSLNGIKDVSITTVDLTSGAVPVVCKYDSLELNSQTIQIDTNFIQTMNIDLLYGRNINETDNQKTTSSILVNEVFAERLGVENPVGMSIYMREKNMNIVGLVKDFHFSSMKYSTPPLVLINGPLEFCNYYLISIKADELNSSISEIKNIWQEFDGKRDMKYSFLDDSIEERYRGEERIKNIISTVTIIALFISLLGLLGLTMLLLMQKIKEIGIRKINGATTKDILIMINKEFAKYLLIAALVAIPVSYYGLSVWLENFVYKTPLSLWVFVVCFFFLGFVVIATISYKSIRASLNNPIDSIKYE